MYIHLVLRLQQDQTILNLPGPVLEGLRSQQFQLRLKMANASQHNFTLFKT